jgi:uncharacterized protein (TIGR02246 family)
MRIVLPLVCVLAGGLQAQARSAGPDSPARLQALRAEIQAVSDSMVAAFNRGDLLAVARFYTDDARVDGERGALVVGRDAINKYWTGIRNAKSWKLEVIAVGGHRDQPWQTGRSTLVQSGTQGDQISVVEYLAVWRRDARGALRLAVDYYRY